MSKWFLDRRDAMIANSKKTFSSRDNAVTIRDEKDFDLIPAGTRVKLSRRVGGLDKVKRDNSKKYWWVVASLGSSVRPNRILAVAESNLRPVS